MGKRDKELEGVNLLDLVPVRLAEWEESGERITVLRPRPSVRGPRSLLERMLYYLAARRIRLDDVGTAAWRALDGTRSVREIAAMLQVEFGEQVAPAEERLGFLVRVMRRERLVGYRGWDDVDEEGDA